MSLDKTCPRCKSTSFRNPNLNLLVNICGHKLCDNCVDVLFVRPTAPCFECGIVLRKNEYRKSKFENPVVEREIEIRQKLEKIYNNTITNFLNCPNPQLEYDNYLEHVEDLIYNLTNGIDVDKTKREIDAYKVNNEETIKLNNAKNAAARRALTKLLTETEKLKANSEETIPNIDALLDEKPETIPKPQVSNVALNILSKEQITKVKPHDTSRINAMHDYPKYEYNPQFPEINGPTMPESYSMFENLGAFVERNECEIAGGHNPMVHIKFLIYQARRNLYLNLKV